MINVMKKAWVMAKGAAVMFGGKAHEYFALSLKEVWKDCRIAKMIELFKAAKVKIKGTKRQVEVAFEIRAEYQMNIENRAAEMRGFLKSKEQFAALEAALEKIKAEVAYTDALGAASWIESKGGHVNWAMTDLDRLAKRNGLVFDSCPQTGKIFGLQQA